jgi:hypothetical protein
LSSIKFHSLHSDTLAHKFIHTCSLSLSLSHTNSLTYDNTRSFTHSHTHTNTYNHSPTLSHTLTHKHKLTHTHKHKLTHTHTHTHTTSCFLPTVTTHYQHSVISFSVQQQFYRVLPLLRRLVAVFSPRRHGIISSPVCSGIIVRQRGGVICLSSINTVLTCRYHSTVLHSRSVIYQL